MSAENLSGTLSNLQYLRTSPEQLPDGTVSNNQKREGCYVASCNLAAFCAIKAQSLPEDRSRTVKSAQVNAQLAPERAIRFGSTKIPGLAHGVTGPSPNMSEIKSFKKTFNIPEADTTSNNESFVKEISLQFAPGHLEILHDFLTAIKDGKQRLVYSDPNTKRRWAISSFSGSSNGLVIERRQGEVNTATQGDGAEQSSSTETIEYDVIFFSNLEWENMRLDVEHPGYAARYAVLKKALHPTREGGVQLQDIGPTTFVNAEMRLYNETVTTNDLPVLVSDGQLQFMIWRNPDLLPHATELGQLQIVPVTSPALVEQVVHASRDPDKAIRRLKRLNTEDVALRLGIRDEATKNNSAAENNRVKDQLERCINVPFQIDVDTADGAVGTRTAKIFSATITPDGGIFLNIRYLSKGVNWNPVEGLQFEHCEALVVQVRDFIPFVGGRKIAV